jgi:hypothetical protein
MISYLKIEKEENIYKRGAKPILQKTNNNKAKKENNCN